jgi:hypothetical protein
MVVKKVVLSALITGCLLLALSILGLYCTIWLFPSVAVQYFDPTFDLQSERAALYFIHPFVAGSALAWFWDRSKGLFKGSFLNRSVEFGLLYWLVAVLPMMWLIYSAIDVSLLLVGSWLLFGLIQGIVAGLVFQKINA